MMPPNTKRCEYVTRREIKGISRACREMGYSRIHVRRVLEGKRDNVWGTLAAIAFYHPELFELPMVPGHVVEDARRALQSTTSAKIVEECEKRKKEMILKMSMSVGGVRRYS